MEHPFLMFLDHTQRRSTVGRTPLDEWSARRRDLYLTTHDNYNRQISMPPVGFEPTISAGERPQAAHQQNSRVQMILCAMLLCSIAHSIICTRLFRGKTHSDWINGIEILQVRWQHGEKVGYCYRSGLEKTLCKWEIYVPLVTKGLKRR